MESYLQLILRTPPRHLSSPQAYRGWCQGAVGGNLVGNLGATHSLGVMFWTLGYIALWMLVARAMHRRKIYIKL